jgi:hypothetical protein
MNITYFVTEKWIKDNTSIGDNVNYKDVVINLKPVCDAYIRPILGTYFYKDLLNKWNNQTASATELTLIEDYIKPSIAWKAASESVLTLSYQLKNKGLQIQNGDYSSSPEYKVIMFMYHHYSDRASLYIDLLKKYIIDNKHLFNNYTSSLNKDSIIKNNNNIDDIFNKNIIII